MTLAVALLGAFVLGVAFTLAAVRHQDRLRGETRPYDDGYDDGYCDGRVDGFLAGEKMRPRHVVVIEATRRDDGRRLFDDLSEHLEQYGIGADARPEIHFHDQGA